MIKMKRLSTIIMALALVLGMSQCKKQETPTNGNSGEMVHITLNVNDSESLAVNVNDNGGRHAVAPNLGVIQFTNGDKLYVGNNNHYVGYLNYVVDESGRRFDGYIDGSACSTSDKLHFYFLGGKGPDVTTINDNPESFTISIANQTDNLPVLCYGISNEYYSTNGSYTASLAYKCALVKFVLNNDTYNNWYLSDVYDQATISFATTAGDAFTPIAAKTDSKGRITLHREQGNVGVRWAILLAGTTLPGVSNPLNENDFITDLDFQVQRPDKDDVVKNNITGEYSTFTVGPNKKVWFSKANLKYTPGTGTWGFHKDQISECVTPDEYGATSHGVTTYFVGQSNLNNPGRTYNTSEMDRFSWGYNETTSASEGGESSNPDYVHGGGVDLSVADGTDWGCVFTGVGNDYWRTLTANEWDSLLFHRGSKSFMMISCIVPNKDSTARDICRGLLLFPDGFDETQIAGLTMCTGTNNTNLMKPGFHTYLYNKVDYTYDEIGTGYAYVYIDKGVTDAAGNYYYYTNPNSNMYKLLEAGCVFLPAVGYRMSNNGSNYDKYNYYETDSQGYYAQGYYWTASSTAGTSLMNQSKYLWFGMNGTNSYYAHGNSTSSVTETVGVNNSTYIEGAVDRQIGMCVRLVWDAN
jgi:hypothetical protein